MSLILMFLWNNCIIKVTRIFRLNVYLSYLLISIMTDINYDLKPNDKLIKKFHVSFCVSSFEFILRIMHLIIDNISIIFY